MADANELLQSIERKFHVSGDSNELMSTIPEVREGHGYGDRDAYEPSIISIGPYHRGKLGLQPMEKLKWKCFDRLRTRSTMPSLESCIHELRTQEMKARRYYSARTEERLPRRDFVTEEHPSSDDFVEMMLLDACFILEYCTCVRDGTLSGLLNNKIWMDTAIRNDLLLLENQLPFFVVVVISATLTSESREQLMDLVQCFCKHVSPVNTNECLGKEHPMRYDVAQHLLHIYYRFLFSSTDDHVIVISSDSTATNLSYQEKPICTIRSAMFLKESGIKLRRKMHMTDMVLDANFRNGVMEITPLLIDAFTVSQLRNLIAFEKSDPYAEPRAIAFAQFMDYIINTSKDVALLRQKGIMVHTLGSDEETATIFNQLTSGALGYRTPELERMYKDVDKYCKAKHHQWRAVLVRDYFGRPWVPMSFVAAVVLLSLIFLLTFFSIYPYFRPRQP